jgi:hypothetical protein
MEQQPKWMKNRAPAPWGSSIATTNSDFGPPVLQSNRRRFQRLSTVGFDQYARTPYKHKTRLLVEIKPKAEQLVETRTISRDRKPMMWRPADAPLRTSDTPVEDENYLTPQNIETRNLTRDRVIEGMRFNNAISVLSDNRRTQRDVDAANRTVRDVFARDVAGMATLKREFNARQPMRAIMLPPGGALATAPPGAAPIGGGAPPPILGPPAEGALGANGVLTRRIQKAQDDAARAAYERANQEALTNATNAANAEARARLRLAAQTEIDQRSKDAFNRAQAAAARAAADADLQDAERDAKLRMDSDAAELKQAEMDVEDAVRQTAAANAAFAANQAEEPPEKKKADAAAAKKAADDAAKAAAAQAAEDAKNAALAASIASAMAGMPVVPAAPAIPVPTRASGVVSPIASRARSGISALSGPLPSPFGSSASTAQSPPGVGVTLLAKTTGAPVPGATSTSAPSGQIQPASAAPTSAGPKQGVYLTLKDTQMEGEMIDDPAVGKVLKKVAMSLELPSIQTGDMTGMSAFTSKEKNDQLLELSDSAPDIRPLIASPALIDILLVGSRDALLDGQLSKLFHSMADQYYTENNIQPSRQRDDIMEKLVTASRLFWAADVQSTSKRFKAVRTFISMLVRNNDKNPISGHVWNQVGSGLVGGATDQASLAEELKDKPQFESNEQGLIAETLQPGAKPDIRITGIHMGTEMKTVASIRAGQFVPFASLKRRRPPVVLRIPNDEQWSTTMIRDTVSQFQTFAHSEPPRKITRLLFPKSHLGILKGNTSSAL